MIQVVNFTFGGSVFDILALSLVRSIILVCYYTWCKLRRAWVIASITTISLAYDVAKYILFYSDTFVI